MQHKAHSYVHAVHTIHAMCTYAHIRTYVTYNTCIHTLAYSLIQYIHKYTQHLHKGITRKSTVRYNPKVAVQLLVHAAMLMSRPYVQYVQQVGKYAVPYMFFRAPEGPGSGPQHKKTCSKNLTRLTKS